MTTNIIYFCRHVSLAIALILASSAAQAEKSAVPNEYLVKFKAPIERSALAAELMAQKGVKTQVITEQWLLYKPSSTHMLKAELAALAKNPEVEFIQPNYRLSLLEDYRIADPLRRRALQKSIARFNLSSKPMPADNPPIPAAGPITSNGADPSISKQWGLIDIGATQLWSQIKNPQNIVVAVIDTGIDYTHEDLAPNIWRNKGEMGTDANGHSKENNGIDDDNNGVIDDVIGWDFAADDNKPFDLAVDPMKLLSGGGNPGHGTHCAGTIGARGGNGVGISGINPQIQVMGLRFMDEKGQGTTANAVRAIRYAVLNGAKVLSNSWGSEGDDPSDNVNNQALKDAINFAADHDVLFIAAAGNGHSGVGYDNDTDPAPGVPASYDMPNIISVAAIDRNDNLGSFSNWGAKTVHIGAPGLAVFSTMVGGTYSDKVIDTPAIEVDWDGTSMATPHVAGAAALYWSEHPNKTYQEVKAAILSSAKPIPSLQGKVVSNGKLDMTALFRIK